MLEGIMHAVLVTFIPIYGYGYLDILGSGQIVGLWDLGIIVFLAVIMVTTLRIAVEVSFEAYA